MNMPKANEARIIIRSHTAKLPRYKLNILLQDEDALKVLVYALDLKLKHEEEINEFDEEAKP